MGSYTSTSFDIMKDGDFNLGNDKDLVSTIYPINNELSSSIQNQELRIETGSIDVSKVARIRQINQKPYINVLTNIFNGTGYVQAPVNPYSVRVPLSEDTSGMQFQPEVNEGTLQAYDNLFFRDFYYPYSSEDSYYTSNADTSIQTKVYSQFGLQQPATFDTNNVPLGTMDVSPAFNMRLVASLIGGKMDPKLVSKVTVNGKPFSDSQESGFMFQLAVEP